MIVELSIIGVCMLILLTILVTLIYLGYFSHVEVKAGSSPVQFAGKPFAYKSFKDNYSGIGFQFTKLHNLTAVQPTDLRNKLSEAVAVGIYFDNPNEVTDECRFTVGLLLVGQSDCEEVKELLTKEEFNLETFPDADNVVSATFPFKGSVSIPIAIRAVYPKLNDFIKDRRLIACPSMEFYEKDYIHFILPLDKHKEFKFYKNPDDVQASDDETNEPVKVRSSRRNSSDSSFDELTLEDEIA